MAASDGGPGDYPTFKQVLHDQDDLVQQTANVCSLARSPDVGSCARDNGPSPRLLDAQDLRHDGQGSAPAQGRCRSRIVSPRRQGLPDAHVVWRRLEGLRQDPHPHLRGRRDQALDRHGALPGPRHRLRRRLGPLGHGPYREDRHGNERLQHVPHSLRHERSGDGPAGPDRPRRPGFLVDHPRHGEPAGPWAA